MQMDGCSLNSFTFPVFHLQSLQPHPRSSRIRQTWRPTSDPTWACPAALRVTLNHRSPGEGRTDNPFSTGPAHMALSLRAEEAYTSLVSLWVWYEQIHQSTLNALCSHLDVPLWLSDLWVEDEAVYICEAQNHFGRIESRASITVTGLGKSSGQFLFIYWFI